MKTVPTAEPEAGTVEVYGLSDGWITTVVVTVETTSPIMTFPEEVLVKALSPLLRYWVEVV